MTDIAATRRDSGEDRPPDGPTLARTSRDGDRPAFVRMNLLPPLAERFAVVRDLSTSGGEADLLLCRRLLDDQLVVVKQYRAAHSEVTRSGLDMVARADPAHVVEIYESDQWEGHWWEVMEYVEGGSLAEFAAAHGGRLDTSTADTVLRELADALDHLHGLGGVHRDVKPSNVLVRSREPMDLVLADFGLTVLLAQSREMRSGSRTTAYGAPEAAWGDTQPGRDWWSLGISLLELLTGRHPFQRENGSWLEDARINAELATRPIDLSGVDDTRWILLLRGLLTRDPALRWGSGEVRAWLSGDSPAVRESQAAVSASRDGAEQGMPAFAFAGRSFRNRSELAAAMAERWDDACELVAGRDLEELVRWLGAARLTHETTEVVMRFRAAEITPDRLVAEIVYLLDPAVPPTLGGLHIGLLHLTALSAAAAAQEPKAADVVERLRRGRVLIAWAACDDGDRLVVIDDQWQRMCRELDSLTKATPQAHGRDQLLSQHQRWYAVLLGCAADDATAAELIERAWNMVDDGTPRAQWFHDKAVALCAGDVPPGPVHALELLAISSAAQEEEAARLAQLRQIAEEQAREKRRQEDRLREVAEEQKREKRRREIEAAEIERSAASILGAADGPAARYVAALEIERAAAAMLPDMSQRGELLQRGWLPPLPENGAASTRVVALAAQLPLATERLRAMAKQFAGTAARCKRDADRGVAELPAMPAPPIDRGGKAPDKPSADPSAAGFRTVSLQALVAVAAAALDWIWGASTYKNNGNAPGGLWFLQIAILLVCGFVILAWFASITDGREGRKRERAAKSAHGRESAQYNTNHKEYLRLQGIWERTNLAHIKLLHDAEERRRREYRTAADVDAMADRIAGVVSSLMETDALPALEKVAKRVREWK